MVALPGQLRESRKICALRAPLARLKDDSPTRSRPDCFCCDWTTANVAPPMTSMIAIAIIATTITTPRSSVRALVIM